jgi:hypothetical protein
MAVSVRTVPSQALLLDNALLPMPNILTTAHPTLVLLFPTY